MQRQEDGDDYRKDTGFNQSYCVKPDKGAQHDRHGGQRQLLKPRDLQLWRPRLGK